MYQDKTEETEFSPKKDSYLLGVAKRLYAEATKCFCLLGVGFKLQLSIMSGILLCCSRVNFVVNIH